MAAHYSIAVIWSEEDEEYIATSAEFPHLSYLAPTAEAAVVGLQEAMAIAIDLFMEQGDQLPEPIILRR